VEGAKGERRVGIVEVGSCGDRDVLPGKQEGIWGASVALALRGEIRVVKVKGVRGENHWGLYSKEP